MRFLLDTNVISELRRPWGEPSVKEWVRSQPSQDLAISVVTVIEIETAILGVARRDHAQAARLTRWLEESVIPGFRGRILPIDLAVARHVAQQHVPDRAPQHDAQIAGTALALSLTVVTRNTDDFAASGVPLLNPWPAPE